LSSNAGARRQEIHRPALSIHQGMPSREREREREEGRERAADLLIIPSCVPTGAHQMVLYSATARQIVGRERERETRETVRARERERERERIREAIERWRGTGGERGRGREIAARVPAEGAYAANGEDQAGGWPASLGSEPRTGRHSAGAGVRTVQAIMRRRGRGAAGKLHCITYTA
jgi:hypothetical protein